MLVIRAAVLSDLTSISALLRSDGMRTEGVLESSTRYWVAEDGLRVVGAIGLELGDGCVLLRSAIVALSSRGQGVGGRLRASLGCLVLFRAGWWPSNTPAASLPTLIRLSLCGR